MCGVFFSSKSNFETHGRVSKSLQLRGPDGSESLKFEKYLIHFTRLAIRDLAGGNQPYETIDGQYICAINGELYNENLIRSYLNNNSKISATGDMQILGEYLSQDIQNINHAEGMFAGFIFDKVKNRIFFFRDKVGEKPLYYLLSDGVLTISSTLTAIIEHHDLGTSEINLESLYKGHQPRSQTIFRNIKEVLPGQIVEFDLTSKELHVTQYWSWPARSKKKSKIACLQEGFENVLLSVSSDSSASDVPICMLLSGGLDSAAVLSALNRTQKSPIPAFTLGFENATFDESNMAALTAKALGSSHEIVRVSNLELAEHLQKALDDLDSPILDPAYLSLHLLSKKIRKDYGFKVAISGDGGDELFRGYELFKIGKSIKAMNSFPARNILPNLLSFINPLLTLNENRNSYQFKVARLLSVLENSTIPWYETALSPFSGTALFEKIAKLSSESKSLGVSGENYSPERLEYYFQQEILPQVYLKKSDNASMVNGLELRIPLLHAQMIDFAMSIPIDFFEKYGHKHLVRKYLEGLLPSSVLNSKKRGFSVPLPAILRNVEMPKWRLDIISIDSNSCKSIWKRGCLGDLNSARTSYALMVLNNFLNKSTSA